MTGRTFAIGDIHGCDRALEGVLQQIKPDLDDHIILLGDIIDRGPNAAHCVEILMNLYNRCRLTLVAGNHEEMMFEALETGLKGSRWLMYGGDVALASYGGKPEKIPPMHLRYLSSGLDSFETENDIFVHANLDPDLDLNQQTIEILRWQHLTGEEQPHKSGKRVICGHTPQQTGVPLVFDGWVCIDTYAYGGMFLTALNVDTNEIFQANQQGFKRGGITLADLA